MFIILSLSKKGHSLVKFIFVLQNSCDWHRWVFCIYLWIHIKLSCHLVQFDMILLFILVLPTTAIYDPSKKILNPKEVNIKCPFPDFDSSGQVSLIYRNSRLPEKVHRAAKVHRAQLPSLLCLFSPRAVIQQAESHSHTDGGEHWTFARTTFNKLCVFYATK